MTPKQGTLVIHHDIQCYFHANQDTTQTPVKLNNLNQDVLHLIQTLQLVRGHPPFHTIFNDRRQLTFNNMVAHHVSITSINNMDALTLLNMHKLSAHDHKIWQQG